MLYAQYIFLVLHIITSLLQCNMHAYVVGMVFAQTENTLPNSRVLDLIFAVDPLDGQSRCEMPLLRSSSTEE